MYHLLEELTFANQEWFPSHKFRCRRGVNFTLIPVHKAEVKTLHTLILGGGYGGLRVALDLSRLIGKHPKTKITLVNKHDYHQFRTELHRTAAGTASPDRIRIPFQTILRGLPIEFVKGEVTKIDPEQREVSLQYNQKISYDRCVVALGSRPEFYNIPGLKEHALLIQNLNSAARIRRHLEAQIAKAAELESPIERRPYVTVAVGGGGLTGVEFVAELAERLPQVMQRHGLPPEELRLITIEASPEILRGMDQRLVQTAQRRLAENGVQLWLNTRIVALHADKVELEGAAPLHTKSFIWTGGIRGNEVVEAAFTTKAQGRAVVNEYLQSVDAPDVYIIGDCALALHPKTGNPVAPTAQNAIAQGRLVARNIAAEMTGQPLKPYQAQNFGMVASLGKGVAVADVAGYPLVGIPAALLKDLITLRYIWSIGGPKLLFRRIMPRRLQLSPSAS